MTKVRTEFCFKQSQSGQALTEYTVLILVAALLALGLASFFKSTTSKGMTVFNAVLESELRTGNFQTRTKNPITVWEN